LYYSIWGYELFPFIFSSPIQFNIIGGTSVTYGLIPPKEEKRTIVSVDMHEMNKIKWVDKSNMTACIEAGIPGKVLQERLEAMGFTMGHEPDSAEFSTLG
jgi:alkyldihydroxyacetonephosphate synthase